MIVAEAILQILLGWHTIKAAYMLYGWLETNEISL